MKIVRIPELVLVALAKIGVPGPIGVVVKLMRIIIEALPIIF
ncbi:MAG: hypothetical protein QXJ51_04695 [Sulfolobales archaeon]